MPSSFNIEVRPIKIASIASHVFGAPWTLQMDLLPYPFLSTFDYFNLKTAQIGLLFHLSKVLRHNCFESLSQNFHDFIQTNEVMKVLGQVFETCTVTSNLRRFKIKIVKCTKKRVRQ